jgi:hypothetical protein
MNGLNKSTKKYLSLTERIFTSCEDPVASDTTSIMPITNVPAAVQRKHSIVPELMLDYLPPRYLHYFSDDSECSGLDISFEQKKAYDNSSLAKKYDLSSYCDRMKQDMLKNETTQDTKFNDRIIRIGKKIFEESKKES